MYSQCRRHRRHFISPLPPHYLLDWSLAEDWRLLTRDYVMAILASDKPYPGLPHLQPGNPPKRRQN